MANKPTKEQIEAERVKLLEMLPKIRRYSAFGDDHHAAIKAVMRILDGRDTAEDYDDESTPDNVLEEVRNAQQWMDGDAASDYFSPSDSWKELLQP